MVGICVVGFVYHGVFPAGVGDVAQEDFCEDLSARWGRINDDRAAE